MKDVAIIITCYNYGKYLKEAIESCLSQTVPCEIIVVDDGSTDNTRAVCIEYLDRINYLYKPNGKTNAASRNFGIAHTPAKFLVTLDADDILYPTFVEECLATGSYLVTVNAQEFESSDGILYSAQLDDSIYQGNTILTCAFFHRDYWEQVKGFDEDVPISGIEDWTFWIKLWRVNAVNENLNKVLFKYRVHVGSMTQTNIAPNGHIFREWMLKKGYL